MRMLRADISQVVVGGIVIFNPNVLGEILSDSCFFMRYKVEDRSLEFFHNNGDGGRTIFVIEGISHESAAKLARGAGLKAGDKENDELDCFWEKSMPIIHLYHDGSEDAEKIRLEACRLNLKCRVKKISHEPWFLTNGQFIYSSKSNLWSVNSIITEMQGWAEKWGTKDKFRNVQKQVSAE